MERWSNRCFLNDQTWAQPIQQSAPDQFQQHGTDDFDFRQSAFRHFPQYSGSCNQDFISQLQDYHQRVHQPYMNQQSWDTQLPTSWCPTQPQYQSHLQHRPIPDRSVQQAWPVSYMQDEYPQFEEHAPMLVNGSGNDCLTIPADNLQLNTQVRYHGQPNLPSISAMSNGYQSENHWQSYSEEIGVNHDMVTLNPFEQKCAVARQRANAEWTKSQDKWSEQELLTYFLEAAPSCLKQHKAVNEQRLFQSLEDENFYFLHRLVWAYRRLCSLHNVKRLIPLNSCETDER